MLLLVHAIPILISLLTGANSLNRNEAAIMRQSDRVHFKCAQAAPEQNALINQAIEQQYLVRRVEFVGNEYTRDNVLRRKITLEECDVFTRENLIKSLESVSTLKKIIYPVKLSDVEIRLDRSEKIIDMTICFKETKRSPGSSTKRAS